MPLSLMHSNATNLVFLLMYITEFVYLKEKKI